MPTQIDLTLPKTNSAEINEILLHSPGDLNPAVLYVHIELSEDAIKQLVKECNNSSLRPEDSKDAVVLAPQHDFTNKPLRASYDYHITEIVPHGQYDRSNYVAVVDEDWKKKGVVEVTLIHGQDESAGKDGDTKLRCIIDTMRCPAQETGIQIENLQIANVSWSEYKEQYE